LSIRHFYISYFHPVDHTRYEWVATVNNTPCY
jgi:hypothetical protein